MERIQRIKYNKELFSKQLYFDKAFDQYIKYKEWHDMLINNTMPKDADFKSALLRNANLGVIYELDSEFFEYPISDLPKKIKEQILKNPKYKTLFAKQWQQ